MVNSEESLAALFLLLARVEGGPEAICLEDNGAGADALVTLAVEGPEGAQAFALDALFQAATRQPRVRCLPRKKGMRHILQAAESLTDGPPAVKAKVRDIMCYDLGKGSCAQSLTSAPRSQGQGWIFFCPPCQLIFVAVLSALYSTVKS